MEKDSDRQTDTGSEILSSMDQDRSNKKGNVYNYGIKL